MKIVDNFLTNEEHNFLLDNMSGENFPWFLQKEVAYYGDESKCIYFTHIFYNETKNSAFFDKFIDNIFVNKMKINSLIRVKGNLYPYSHILNNHSPHIDYDFEHKGAIYYLNDNDGFTILEDGTKIESVANRMLFFDPTKKHQSTDCTNTKFRLNINFNYY